MHVLTRRVLTLPLLPPLLHFPLRFCGPAAAGSGYARNCSVGFERPAAPGWAVADCRGTGGRAAAADWRDASYGPRLLGQWKQLK